MPKHNLTNERISELLSHPVLDLHAVHEHCKVSVRTLQRMRAPAWPAHANTWDRVGETLTKFGYGPAKEKS